MELQFDIEPQNFLKNVSADLERETTIHSFILSLTSRYVQNQKPLSLMVRGVNPGKTVIATGIQTESDRALIISNFSESHAKVFAELLASKLDALPGVNGPAPAVDAFAQKWTSLRDKQANLCINMRLFEITALNGSATSAGLANGYARPAHTEDRNLIFKWLRAFHDEAVPHDPKPSDESLQSSIDAGIKDKEYFVWDDSHLPVCLVGSRRETLTERWIAPVYTPHEFRGRGYATALTTYVSEKILASGKKGILFTDLANPTSNGIYQNIGYKPIADFRHYLFS